MPCVAEADTFRYRGYGIKRLTEGLGYAERVMEMCSGMDLMGPQDMTMEDIPQQWRSQRFFSAGAMGVLSILARVLWNEGDH